MKQLVAGLLLCSVGAPAFAVATIACETGKGPAEFATVHRVQGLVEAIPAKGKARALHEGDAVRVGERVRASGTGEAVLIARDASMIGLRPNSELVPDSFAAEGKASDHLALRLLRGGFRIATGWIGLISPDQDSVITPTTTIGIRGTDHEPYVLSAAAAGATPYSPGVYDKVNRGATVMKTVAGEVQVDSGKVGFAVDKPRKRGLLTLLMPVLLERVPDFYVGGKFEEEMDAYSRNAEAASRKRLEERRAQPDCLACGPAKAIGAKWIAAFDEAVESRDAGRVLELFTEDLSVTATVLDTRGKPVKNTLTRQELARSAVTAMKGLDDYHQQRKTLDIKTLAQEKDESCPRLRLRSVVVEQGKLSGKPYRLESQEEYILAPRNGTWLAVTASVVQR